MIETIRTTVITPTLTPRMVSDERTLFDRSVSIAIHADSLTSSNRIITTMSDKLQFVVRTERMFRVGLMPDQAGGSPLLNPGNDKLKFDGHELLLPQRLNRIQPRGAPCRPEPED